ncbi:MAG: hypothetical protein ACPGOY_00290 [Rhodospirillaceae bacterium]
MATNRSQARWRAKNKMVKRQLNVMARKFVHEILEDVSEAQALKGKAEAVTYCAFITLALQQHAANNPEAAKLLQLYGEAYRSDRDILAP